MDAMAQVSGSVTRPVRAASYPRVRPVQTLAVLLLLLGPVRTSNSSRCYEEWELSKVAGRKLASHYPQPPEPRGVVAHDSPSACPLDLYMHHWNLEDRSLSPWRYVWRTMKDHYPSTYVEAQCLCSGCIMIKNKGTPELSHDYNSVPVNQTRVFLKRERCSDGHKYYLKPISAVVTVGCTCARPRISV
ncbi:interleukin-17C isoform X1 [Phycodurus eques]|uniref:interleukin-17C isoform X1 n=1 Tax=Phycodurus eques TaxID=693459 RepID=UPI002ACD3D81|nr:interleukin-17C isoform X1 [Phycodurus eques]XP_061533387.1 interleukin-17C isoform X1 [Phycodurus eques]